MNTRFWLLCVILLSHQPVLGKTPADSLYHVAEKSLNTVPIKQSIQAFKRVLKANHKYAAAHYQLCQLYATYNTVNDRQRAKRAIEEAIRLEPENVDYQLALGDLLWQQSFWTNAEAQYLRAFRCDTLSAKAAFKVGSRALNTYLKFKDLEFLDIITGLDGPTYHIFYWDHFAEKDLERAKTFLNRSTHIDPTYRDAYYQLGLAHYENNQPGQLTVVAGRLLKHVPNDKDGLLFMGLGFQAINQLGRAHTLFEEALKRMSDEERTVMESVDLIADAQTQDQIQQAEAHTYPTSTDWTDSDPRNLFWQKQDPLYLTQYNERRIAHYGRVAYANLRYSRPEHNIAGWQTDMGSAHIKYGRALKRRVKRAGSSEVVSMDRFMTDQLMGMVMPEELGGSSALTSANFQTEIWIYENFNLEFIAADGRNGRLASSTPKTPRYIDPYRRQKYTVPHQVLAFKEDDQVRLEVTYALPKRRFKTETATLDNALFIFDANGRKVGQQVQQAILQWPKSTIQNLWNQHRVIAHQMKLQQGDYQVVMEALDQKTGHIATFKEQRPLSFIDTALSLSDLFLARRIHPKTPFPENRKDLAILPNPIHTYTPKHPVYVYLELYNLKPDDFGRTRFDLTYQLSVPDKEEINPAQFMDQRIGRETTLEVLINESASTPIRVEEDERNQITRRPTVEYRVKYTLPKSIETDELKRATDQGVAMTTSVTAEYEGDRVNDFTYLQFDTSQLPKGIHKLTVTITDKNTNRYTNKYALFRVIE